MFRPLVPHTKLNQQSTGGSLEVKAALEHSGLCGGSFGWQINNHQTLKLLEELLWHRVACSLGLLPRHLEPVERLIHLHHLLMESARAYYAWAQVWNTDKTRQRGLMLTDDANMRNIQYTAFLYDVWWCFCVFEALCTCGSQDAGWVVWGWGFQSAGCRTVRTPPAAEGASGSDRFPCRDLLQEIQGHSVMKLNVCLQESTAHPLAKHASSHRCINTDTFLHLITCCVHIPITPLFLAQLLEGTVGRVEGE